jgi:hypothetical protein
MQTSCPHCHRKLPLFRRLLGKSYCSAEHENLELSQQSLIALARVMDPALASSARRELAAPAWTSAQVPAGDPQLPDAPLIRVPIPPLDGGHRPKIAEEAFEFSLQPAYSTQSAAADLGLAPLPPRSMDGSRIRRRRIPRN